MEPIGQATQFAQTAMDVANKVARQQAEDPGAFSLRITESGRSDPGRFAENPSPMSITQTGNTGSAFSDIWAWSVTFRSNKPRQARPGKSTLRPRGPATPAVIASEETAVSFQLMVEVEQTT